MSLADELLCDLDTDSDDDEIENGQLESKALESNENGGYAEKIKIDEDNKSKEEGDLKGDSVHEACKLRNSSQLNNVLDQIKILIDLNRKSSEIIGSLENDQEYQLICDANVLSVDIEKEISLLYKIVKRKYQKRFPELEFMIMIELNYIQAVSVLRNDLNNIRNDNEKLHQILDPSTIMIISITALTTQGQHLTDQELSIIDKACAMALELAEIKMKIFDYVESRMNFFAPNLSAIVGAITAAKLVAVAGGLTKLSRIPACNIFVLGANKYALEGFSKVATLPHTGFIYYSNLVQNVPVDLRKEITRIVANKVALAARVDACRESVDGLIGKNFLEDIEKKIEKQLELPPVKYDKPLPRPLDAPKKNRGGKRVQKMKERIAVTEMRKQQNRMKFGEIEGDAYEDELGYTRRRSGIGGIRSAQIDERTKIRISKALQKNLQRQDNIDGTTTAGIASVAFTPLQGLEIHNPNASEKMVSETNNKKFSGTTRFREQSKQ